MTKLITVKISPRSSKNEISIVGKDSYKIKITAPPVDGSANEALIELLSDYLSVSKSCIEIVRGLKSRIKLVKIIS